VQVDASALADRERFGVAVQMACAMKLFSSLIVWPAPGAPTWITFSAKQRAPVRAAQTSRRSRRPSR